MPQIPDHYAAPEGRVEPLIESAAQLAEKRYFTASEHEDVVTLRELIQELALRIDVVVPPGRNKSLALTALEDVQMRASRGIFAPEELR